MVPEQPSAPVKVLHIGKYFPPYAGGMETYLRDLMAAQARQGIDVAALVHQSDLGFKSEKEEFRAGGQTLPITRAAVWARMLFTPISPTFPGLLSRLIKAKQPDILHLHMPNVSVFWALLLPGARRIPWVVQWQSDVVSSPHSLGLRLFYAMYRPFERAVMKRSVAVIASSPPYLASSPTLQTYRDKCHVVPLGLDPASLPDPKDSRRAPTDDAPALRVLAIGRLTYYKGFDYLIRALAGCENVDLHLVGTGDQEAALKALTKELTLEDRVTFHGQLTDTQLAKEFGTCDCLCLPSIERTEAFGMVLLEAMYLGKATLVSDVSGSGMGWVVDDGLSGELVPPQDEAALANSLGRMQENRDKLRAMGRAGRQKFDRYFHIDESAAGVRKLYQQVLNIHR